MAHNYEVYFSHDGKQLRGELMEYLDKETYSSFFNPLTILGDLDFFLQHHEFDTSKINMSLEYQSLIDTPYDTETCFGIPFDVAHNVKYFSLLSALKRFECTTTSFSTTELDILQDFFNINIRIHNLFKVSKTNATLPFNDELEIYEHFQFGQHDINEIFSNQFSEGDVICYTCATPSDIIFSILHYLISHQYSFGKCKHCEKIFARLHKSTIYCPRYSSLDGFTQYTCRYAVKECKKSCNDKCLTRLNELEPPNSAYEVYNAFVCEFEYNKEQVRLSPTLSNLEALCSTVNKKRWAPFLQNHKSKE